MSLTSLTSFPLTKDRRRIVGTRRRLSAVGRFLFGDAVRNEIATSTMSSILSILRRRSAIRGWSAWHRDRTAECRRRGGAGRLVNLGSCSAQVDCRD